MKATKPMRKVIPSALISLASGLGMAALAQSVDFQRDVQPIFEARCFQCHGSKLQMGNLRLDSKTVAARTIKEGDAAGSSLYQRVAGLGEQAKMPMGGDPLPASQIDLIRRWIDQGARWPESASADGAAVSKHWAFAAPVRPPVPSVRNAAWARTPVDKFVAARLEKEGLSPMPRADRITLLRRISLDLTGLPPSPAETDAFLRDKTPGAYERQVRRLLTSPHYGERWARWWLDAARYADSDGFEKDKQRWVWFYRDWVIHAFNRDLPYDQFIIEQIAGDLLRGASQDQRVATGFLRNSMINEEGGIDPEQFRMEAMFDRMDAIGKAVLGVTVQCAQCHNHKYDPLTQEEYYRMFAFLNNSHESAIAVYTAAEQKKRAEIFGGVREIEREMQHRTPDWRKRMEQWEAAARANQPEWRIVRPEVDDISTGGQKYLPMQDGSLLAAGYAPTKHKVKLSFKPGAGRVTAFRLELLNDPNLPLGGPGRSIKGTGALTEFTVELDNGTDKPHPLKIAGATADVRIGKREIDPMNRDKEELAGKREIRVIGPVEFAIDGKDETAWGHDDGPATRNLPRKAVFVLEKPVEAAANQTLHVYLSQRHGGWNSDDNQNLNLGRVRLSITAAPDPVADPIPAAVREILSISPGKRTPAQEHAVFRYWRTTVPEWEAENAKIAALWREYPEGTSQLVLHERDSPRETRMLTRGDFLKPGKEVDAGVPAFLHPLPKNAPPNRLTFARWLVDRRSPTTARALVNRVWQSYFGTGLVATSEDLGRQAEAPSHPELLDWLAVEFMESGWSLKTLHKLIVTSAVYQQSSHVTPELLEKDAANRLLARGPRFRVDAEIVRDIALAASGLLNRKVGGPSVYPPAPDFLFQPPTSYGPKIWKEEIGEDRYRRALYTFRYRSVPYPVLQNFDAPNGDFACVRRPRSNTPLQALTTLNEPLFFEAAEALGKKSFAAGKTDQDRIRHAFRRCLSRPPTAGEEKELLAFLHKNSGLPPAQKWTALSRIILNLDETITKE
jgi:mono/diheme cytochrome c family protein